MGLKIIVFVKQVPDTSNVKGDAMKPDGTINRAALPAIVNPEDLNALEEALKIKEKLGGTVVAITLGPPNAMQTLKECLYRGVDDVILITDMKFAASDTLATSYALKCAAEKVGAFDLILCGRQAIDGDTAQIGPQVAEKLNLNQITYVTEIKEIDNTSIIAKRSIDGGFEIVKTDLPALLTVANEANEPRPASVKKIMMYKNISCKGNESYNDAYMHIGPGELCSHIKQWKVEDIKADVDLCGLSGSPTKVKNIQNVKLTARATRTISTSDEDIKSLIHELIAEHIVG